MSCGTGYQCASNPALLWLWGRPASAALNWLFELPYATGVALKRKKKIHVDSRCLKNAYWIYERPLRLRPIILVPPCPHSMWAQHGLKNHIFTPGCFSCVGLWVTPVRSKIKRYSCITNCEIMLLHFIIQWWKENKPEHHYWERGIRGKSSFL